jgi:hypothetical protein
MKTYHTDYWTIEKLRETIDRIEFPEFQREPTVWDLEKKQRLIDSILRGFDISSIYVYKKENGGYDCIDGRQRINAIWSFLGINGQDEEDNAFHSKIENEIYDDGGYFKEVHSKRFEKFTPKWQKAILEYKLNIVEIMETEHDEELNLLFLRLQMPSRWDGLQASDPKTVWPLPSVSSLISSSLSFSSALQTIIVRGQRSIGGGEEKESNLTRTPSPILIEH